MAGAQPYVPVAYDSRLTQEVIQVLAEKLKINQKEVGLETNLVLAWVPKKEITDKTLEWDSLDRVEVAMALEERFEIPIPDADLNRFGGVQDIVGYLQTTYPALVNRGRVQ